MFYKDCDKKYRETVLFDLPIIRCLKMNMNKPNEARRIFMVGLV